MLINVKKNNVLFLAVNSEETAFEKMSTLITLFYQ